MPEIPIKEDWKRFKENKLVNGKVHLFRCPNCWCENHPLAVEFGVCISCRYSAYVSVLGEVRDARLKLQASEQISSSP